MALISEKVKIYIIDSIVGRSYWTQDLSKASPDFFTTLGSVEVMVQYDESALANPANAKLAQAEAALDKARSEFAAKEQAMLDRIQSLRALPYMPEGEK